MDTIKLSDLDIHDLGIEIQIAGLVWTGKDHAFVTQFPGKNEDLSNLKTMPMDLAEWESLLRQTDICETEILQQDPTGHIVKALYRRTQRSIDAYVQWAVFQRDHYTCRYCGRTGIPLTVDHIDLWEIGGATIQDNLVSACRSCNKHRGRIPYEQWIHSAYYRQISANLPEEVKVQNETLVALLPDLERQRVIHIRTR
jgi:hypothetical protein